jgi:putative flippase GtrA
MEGITLEAFLLWLASAGGSGTVASFILEELPWFQGLSSKGRKWVSFATMSVLGAGAFVVLTYVPADVLMAIAPYFAIIGSAFVSVFSGSIWHKQTKLD